eukprot:28619_1
MQSVDLLDSLITSAMSVSPPPADANPVINIIHFNDVYNINPVIKKDTDGNIKSISGGAAYFKSFVNMLSPLKPIILFSGDFLSPSDMSTVTNGEHMIPIMNDIGITCGMIGNHDLDFGNDHCANMFSKLNYPTLNTNIMTPINRIATGTDDDYQLDLEPLGKCTRQYIYKYNGNFTVGVLGISENWSCTLTIKPENGVVYLDFIEQCQKHINAMKKDHKIDLMVVLTHSRILNDQLLASKVQGIDLLLGGHDHSYFCGLEENTQTMMVKSGTDFKNVSWIQLQLHHDQKEIDQDANTTKIEADLSACLHEKKGAFMGTRYRFVNRYYNIDMNIKPDVNTEKLVHELSHEFRQQMGQTIGYIETDLDARFSVVRARESTSGNFITDVIRRAYHVDGVILNGGTLRADRIMSAGAFTYKDILDFVPFQDSVVVVKLKGSSIIKALEHAVSGLPKAEGRFPQISGIRFIFDAKEEVGKRVKKVWISRYQDRGIHTFSKAYREVKEKEEDDEDEQLDLIDEDAVYSIATREYLAGGGDGFDVYKNETLETVVDGEEGIPMSVILRNFFWAIDAVNKLLRMSAKQQVGMSKEVEAKNRLSLQSAQSLMSQYSVEPETSSTALLQIEDDSKERVKGKGDALDIGKVSMMVKEEEDGVYIGGALKITSALEQRIMNVEDEIDMQSDAVKPMRNFLKRLPSFVNMQHLPRRQSLLAILDDIEKLNDETQ